MQGPGHHRQPQPFTMGTGGARVTGGQRVPQNLRKARWGFRREQKYHRLSYPKATERNKGPGASLAVQWLRFRPSAAVGTGWIPGRGSSLKKKRKRNKGPVGKFLLLAGDELHNSEQVFPVTDAILCNKE